MYTPELYALYYLLDHCTTVLHIPFMIQSGSVSMLDRTYAEACQLRRPWYGRMGAISHSSHKGEHIERGWRG